MNTKFHPLCIGILLVASFCFLFQLQPANGQSVDQNSSTENAKRQLAEAEKAIKKRIDEANGKSSRRRKQFHYGLDEKEHIVSLSLRNFELAKSDVQLIGKLSLLQKLNLRETNIKNEELKLFKDLDNLTELDLSSAPFISIAGIQHLDELEKLKTLRLNRTKINNASMSLIPYIRSLRELNIGDTKIDDSGLEKLSEAQNLEVLRLTDTEITDKGLVHLKKLRNLKGLTLNRTKVTQAGLETLSQMPNFKWIAKPESVIKELIRRLEAGKHDSVAKMIFAGVDIPTTGQLNIEKTTPIEPSKNDERRKWKRYRLDFAWTLRPGQIKKLHTVVVVERGSVFVIEAGID